MVLCKIGLMGCQAAFCEKNRTSDAIIHLSTILFVNELTMSVFIGESLISDILFSIFFQYQICGD